MKIIYLITKLELGGAQKICLALFDHFYPNAYLLSGPNGLLVQQVKNNKNFIPINSLRRSLSFFSDIKAFFEILFVLRKLKKQHKNIVLHTHSSKAGILGRFAGFLVGCDKIIHTVHGFGFYATNSFVIKKILIFLEQIAVFFSTKIICVSQKDIETGKQLFWGFSKKTVLIRAAINEKTFLQKKYLAFKERKKNIKQKRFIIGTISCFKPQKNLTDLLKMTFFLKQLLPKNQKLILQIIGDGEKRKELENMVKKYKLETNIVFLGWQYNVVRHMKHWNVFCLTSLWEGLPCSLVQARMLNIFSVCYNVGGIAEILNNGQKGVLISKKKYNTMAIKIFEKKKQLIRPKNNVKIVSENLDDFKLNNMIKKHEKLLVDK